MRKPFMRNGWTSGRLTRIRLVDKYRTDLATFVSAQPKGEGVSLAPASVADKFTIFTPFSRWDPSARVSRVVVHKGLVDEIPPGLLESLFGMARPSFANEVFVVYSIAGSD